MEPCHLLLIVEDDTDIREALADYLEIEGYSVKTAANGKEALNILQNLDPGKPCLILLDLMMPVMNGWEFLELKNHNHMLASIPVVVVSAVAERLRKENGVSGHLKKPLDLNVLLKIVTAYCGPPSDD
jgi:CheY-like chemotaxis protein